MDPNANLTEILELSSSIKRTVDRDEMVSTDDADRLADLICSLDGWISHGGFLPARWVR